MSSKKLYNKDLAPTPSNKKNWGWFEIFNVWANDVQSLFVILWRHLIFAQINGGLYSSFI
jgi:Cytosine/uracil/thiamine/allantoin permeases